MTGTESLGFRRVAGVQPTTHASAAYTRPPSWYRGAGGAGDFQPRVFVNHVGQSLGTIGQSLASRPRGSGSSGFGGGGFSGGGMGGGGGGSW